MDDDFLIDPATARERLTHASLHNPIVRAVARVSERDRLSDADHYALMAYHLMRSADEFKKAAQHYAMHAAPSAFAGVPERVTAAQQGGNSDGR